MNDPSTSTDTSGIHHVTSIASDPQRNVDFSTDVLGRPDSERGREGVGTVHHVAVRAPDEETQLAWRDALVEAGLNVTPQKDRQYFHSVYTRDPGGILFEIPTDGPGFTRDESVAELGSSLEPPSWLDGDRETIEAQLSDLDAGTTEAN